MRAEQILEHLNEGVLLADQDLIVTYANPAADLILGARRCVGSDFPGLFRTPEVSDAVRGILAKSEESREPLLFMAPHGDRILWFRAFRSGGDHLIFFHPYIPRLELARMKADYLKGINHQIRSMITSLMITVETLSEELRGDYRRLLSILSRDTARISQLLDDLLSIATYELERDRVEPRRIALGNLVRESVEGLHEAIEAKSIVVENRLGESVGVIEGDPLWLGPVFYNLLKFLLLHSEPLDRIAIEGSGDARHASVTVHASSQTVPLGEDDFRTVPVIEEPRSIDCLYQTGLELPIVREIVDICLGRLSIDRPSGGGVAVTVSFPRKWGERVRVEGVTQ